MTLFLRTSLFLSFVLLFVWNAFAETEVISPTDILPDFGSDPWVTIANFISFGISMTAILSVIAITWGSIQMILASGEEEKVKKSRMMIIYAFVGLIIAGLAYGIVTTVTRLQF